MEEIRESCDTFLSSQNYRGSSVCSTQSSLTGNLQEPNLKECEKFEYGYNRLGMEKSHIIAFEFENQEFVREYTLYNKKFWRCIQCFREKKKYKQARFINGKLFVPEIHVEKCQPVAYKEVMEKQSKLKEKFEKLITTRNCNHYFPESSMEINDDRSYLTKSNFVFTYPSSTWLKEVCKKLDIEYSHDAYKLWAKIEINTFSLTSTFDQCLELSESTDYECLSYFFTGSNKYAKTIQKSLNKYFYINYKSLGVCFNTDFKKLSYADKCIQDTLFSEILTPIHSETLAKWLSCRIGIFQNNVFEKFGSWDTEDEDTITLLMKKENEIYSIVISMTTIHEIPSLFESNVHIPTQIKNSEWELFQEQLNPTRP